MFLAIVIESSLNIVRPAEVLPSAFQDTMRPAIMRDSVSAAVIAYGIVIFIMVLLIVDQVFFFSDLLNAHRANAV
jgi:hypothetical protein